MQGLFLRVIWSFSSFSGIELFPVDVFRIAIVENKIKWIRSYTIIDYRKSTIFWFTKERSSFLFPFYRRKWWKEVVKWPPRSNTPLLFGVLPFVILIKINLCTNGYMFKDVLDDFSMILLIHIYHSNVLVILVISF